MPVTVLDIPTGSNVITSKGDTSMDIYQSQEEWDIFNQRITDFFGIEYIPSIYQKFEITSNKSLEPWNKGKVMDETYKESHKHYKFTPEQYKKVIDNLNQNRHKFYTTERNEKISKSLNGNPLSDERKSNISKSKIGTKHNQETKNKIATSMKGKKRGPYKKAHTT